MELTWLRTMTEGGSQVIQEVCQEENKTYFHRITWHSKTNNELYATFVLVFLLYFLSLLLFPPL